MKKMLALLLAAVMVCSVSACGSSEESSKCEKYDMLLKYLEDENYEQAAKELGRIEERNEAAKEADRDDKDKDKQDDEELSVIDFDKVERNSDGCVKLTKEQFAGLFEKVEITANNWKEYFGDYEFTQHGEELNSFGEVEREWEYTHYVFGLKQDYYADLSGVAFKFAGKKVITDYMYNLETYETTEGYWEFLPNEEIAYGYDVNGNRVNETTIIDGGWGYDKVQESYVADLGNCRYIEGSYYTDYECLAVTGQMLLFHMPEEFKEDEGIAVYGFKENGEMNDYPDRILFFANYAEQWSSYDYIVEYLEGTEE